MIRIDTIVDWILTERCNLNCYYCLQNADTRKAECGPVDYSFIEDTDRTLLFHLTGGEPFLVPNLNDLCNSIEHKGHYISMNTNLTLPVNKFIEQVNPNRFLFINASVHYPYRKLHMAPFMRHYRQLRETGFFVYSTVVMIPDEFEKIAGFIRDYQSQGLILLPKLMRGIEQGRRYPEAYSNEQKATMKKLVSSSIEIMSLNEREKFRIACENNVSIDNWWEIDTRDVGGTRCFDGARYIRITETGDIIYCNGKILGNINTTGFTVLPHPNDCQYAYRGLCSKNI